MGRTEKQAGGNYGREIKSFIYADVIGCGWGTGALRPYGRTMILGNRSGHGLYLLGHLQNRHPQS